MDMMQTKIQETRNKTRAGIVDCKKVENIIQYSADSQVTI